MMRCQAVGPQPRISLLKAAPQPRLSRPIWRLVQYRQMQSPTDLAAVFLAAAAVSASTEGTSPSGT
jgi:hypothetical protein